MFYVSNSLKEKRGSRGDTGWTRRPGPPPLLAPHPPPPLPRPGSPAQLQAGAWECVGFPPHVERVCFAFCQAVCGYFYPPLTAPEGSSQLRAAPQFTTAIRTATETPAAGARLKPYLIIIMKKVTVQGVGRVMRPSSAAGRSAGGSGPASRAWRLLTEPTDPSSHGAHALCFLHVGCRLPLPPHPPATRGMDGYYSVLVTAPPAGHRRPKGIGLSLTGCSRRK